MKQQSRLIAAAACLLLAASPISAIAEPPAHAKAKAKGGASKGKQHVVVKRENVDRRIIVAGNCPPGLAKKNPACLPPGQAKKHDIRHGIGDFIDWNDVHVVTRPGRYGLSMPPSGNRYAIVDGQLVRVNEDSGKILSILRLVEAILD